MTFSNKIRIVRASLRIDIEYTVANSAQALKRARQNVNNRLRNASQRSTLRTSIKKFLKSLEGGDAAAAQVAYREVTSTIDSSVHKGLHHKNRAARLKSRLNTRLRQLNAS